VAFSGSSNTGSFTTDAVDSAALLVQDPAHIGYADNEAFVFEGVVPTGVWTQFTGGANINAGIGLSKSGNTLNVNLGAGIRELPGDEIGVDVATTGGLTVAGGGSADQLAVKKDETTGATVAPVAVGNNGTGVSVDNASILHTTGTLRVGTIDGGVLV
jgi:hypothetical protein